MASKSLEEYLKNNAFTNMGEKFIDGSSFVLRVFSHSPQGVRIYLHPKDQNGETIDFEVKGNELKKISK